jgi:hypothetical protein
MRKIAGLLMVVVASAVAGAVAQEQFSANASQWKRISADSRLYYMYGYVEGVTIERLAAKHPDLPKLVFPPSATPQDLVNALNVFYATPENAQVCWASATEIVSAALAGTPESDSDISVIRKADLQAGCHK